MLCSYLNNLYFYLKVNCKKETRNYPNNILRQNKTVKSNNVKKTFHKFGNNSRQKINLKLKDKQICSWNCLKLTIN